MHLHNTTVPSSLSCDSVAISERVDAYLYRPLQLGDADALGLADARCWVNWRFELRVDGNGKEKLTKVPCMPNGRNASTTNPAAWSTFSEVAAAQDRFDGVGFVFTGTMLGIDLDKCVVDGKVSGDTRAFIETVRSYTESSPSRTGLHTIVGLTAPLHLVRNRHGNYECYTEKRFFTFTAEEWETSFPLRYVTPEDGERYLRMLGYPWNGEKNDSESQTVPSPNHQFTDERLLALARGANNGSKFATLYDTGDWRSLGYPSQSEADLGLCGMLCFWTGRDSERIGSLFRASKLMSPKWDDKRGDSTYGRNTIKFAIENSKEVYTPSLDTGLPPFVLDAPGSGGGMASPQSLRFLPDTDLLTMDIPPTEWQIEHLFAKGSLNMISAPPNQYKSMLSLRAGMCVAHGLPLFGEFETRRTNVLYIQEEDTLSMMKERYNMLLEDGEEVGGVFIAVDTGRKINEAWAHEVVERAKAHNAGFVILDSLRALHTAQENDSDSMQPIMDTLKIITRNDITVLFTHHHRKGVQGFGNEQQDGGMDAARGSSAITAAVYGHITCVEKKDGQPYLVVHQAKLKTAKKLDPFKLKIEEKPDSTMKTKIRFVYSGLYDADVAAVDAMAVKLMDHLRQNKDTVFTRKQFVALKFAKSPEDRTLRDALAKLVDEGKVFGLNFKDLSDADKAKKQGKKPGANASVYKYLSDTGNVKTDADEVA